MKRIYLILSFLILLCVSSCAEAPKDIEPCLKGEKYGFVGGVWHGFIVPVSAIGSIFIDDIAVYAVNNNGQGYKIGFAVGALLLGGGIGGGSRRRR